MIDCTSLTCDGGDGSYCSQCSHGNTMGQATVNGRVYRWEFNHYHGPLFLCADNYTPLKRQPGEKNPVWVEFNEWLLNKGKT